MPSPPFSSCFVSVHFVFYEKLNLKLNFLGVLAGIFLLVLFFVHRYRSSNATANLPRKSIDFNHRNSVFELPAAALSKLQSSAISWRKSKLAVGCLLYAVYFTAETGYFPFATSMLQYLPIRMSAAEAATVMTVCFFS